MTDDNPPRDDRSDGAGYGHARKERNLIKSIHSLKGVYERGQSDRTKHDKKILFWSRVAGVGVGVYTVLTFFITVATIKQVRDVDANFRADERAYLLVEDIKGQPPSFNKDQKAAWNIQFVNYGKSPTVDEAEDAHIWIGPDAFRSMETFFAKSPKKKPRGMAAFITPPNANGGPDGFHYVTLNSDKVITAEDQKFIKTHNGGAVMAGRIWYRDIFGRPHYTDFCRYTLITHAVSDCPRFTDIH